MITDESISFSSFYESIIENAESHILLLDEQYNIITFNPAFYWVFLEAYDVQLRKGAHIFDLLQGHPSTSEKWRKRCSAALKGVSISEVEAFQSHRHQHQWKFYYKGIRLGQARYISVFFKALHSASDPSGKPLEDRETIFSQALNAIHSVVWIVDVNYTLTHVNEAASDFFQKRYHLQLKQGVNFIDAFPDDLEESRQLWRTRLADAFRQKRVTTFLDHARLEEKNSIFETRVNPVWQRNRVIAVVVTMDDIAGSPANDQLQQTQMKELIKLNNELDRFVYSTSHDLRAPLLSIIGVVNLMKRDLPDNQYLKHIESSIIKLDNFVTNIINYSRNNRVEVMPGPIDFSLLIREANESLTYLDTIGHVNCVQQIVEDSRFHSDATRLMVILKNVLANAYQFFDPWKKPFVLIDIRITREYAYIRIEDNGIGMKPEIQTRIFEMFFRGSDRSTGAGLGLYIVNNAVQKLNGKIDIRSTHGVGTVIDVQIPNLIEST